MDNYSLLFLLRLLVRNYLKTVPESIKRRMISTVRTWGTVPVVVAALWAMFSSFSAAKDSKIYRGIDCDIIEYPFYAYIEYYVNKSVFLCGGSLLTTSAVLTAGHCCNGMSNATIYTGFYRHKNDYDQVAKATMPPKIHDKFDSDSLSFDVCIIKLRSPIRLTKRTKLVTLINKKLMKELIENRENKVYDLQLMGYGVNRRDKNGEFLVDDKKPFQCTNSELRTQKKCLIPMVVDDRIRYDKETMFCHYNPDKKTKGSCEGDSGSPILYDGKQIGLISWGPNDEICTEKLEIGLRIDAVLDWITRQVPAKVS